MTSANTCTVSQDIDISAIELEDFGCESPQQRVVAYIETTLRCVIQDIQARPDGRPSVTLKRIRDVKAWVNPFTLQLERQIVDREVTYRFPGRNKDEAWRFGQQ
jgi:meiotic recombination protein SPO11